MGVFAEETAQEYQFTRQAQDAFAIASLARAQAAQKSGAFDREIVAVETEIVGVLNGMYGSYHGSAATDAANSAAIRAAGSAES